MATYEIVGPDGKTYRIEGPEGATREEILAKIAERQAITPAEEGVDFDAMTMVENIPSSTIEVGKDIYRAVRHPVQTEEGLSSLFQSTLRKGQRKVREIAAGVDIAPEGEEEADAAWGELKQRYGSVDRFKRTLMEDPAGVFLDLSLVGLPAKSLRMSRLGQIAAAGEPVNVLKNAVKTAAKVVTPQDFPERLYRAANKLKFPETLSLADEMKALEAGMDRGLRSNWRGERGLERAIDPLRNELNRAVNDASAAGVDISSERLFDYLPELRRSKGGVKVEAIKDAKIIDDAERATRATLLPSQRLTPRAVQDFKSDAYSKIYDAMSGEQKQRTLADAYGAQARGAKDALERAVPETAGINAQLGPLLNLERPLKHAAERLPGEYGNVLRSTVPSIGGGLVATLLAGPEAGFGVSAALAAMTSPLAKTKLAIALRKLKTGDIGWLENNLTRTEMRAVLAVAGRMEEEQ